MTNPLLPSEPTWLTLREASELLGIHYSTLRTWADDGQIPVFRTPGGHRRFRLADVRAFLQERAEQSTQSSNVEHAVEYALTRVRREIAKMPGEWRHELDESVREANRERGRRLFALALNYVMRAEQRTEILDDGRVLGRQYGIEAARTGVSLTETGRAVQFFRRQLLESVRRDDTLDPADMEIRGAIAQFLDEVLYAVLEGYETVWDEGK
ncbi:MAG: helix-turn-helix domain-containing protein [Caldilineaceae bacterium]|nr:helix-turn-helix domain-containing protein [Caldilineaceae bacterium]